MDLTMHRVTEERAHPECGWKHGEGHGVVVLDSKDAATSALTKCAFSWKFAWDCKPERNAQATTGKCGHAPACRRRRYACIRKRYRRGGTMNDRSGEIRSTRAPALR